MRTSDIFAPAGIPVGGEAHVTIIDLLTACLGWRDTEILQQRLCGATQQDIAQSMGMLQSSVSRALWAIYGRARIRDEDTAPKIGLSLRISAGWRDVGAEAKAIPSGLRFPSHTVGHRACWCLKKGVTR